NKPWIADFRDLGAFYKDLYFSQNKLFNSIDRKIEKRVLSNCSGVMSVSKTLTHVMSDNYNLLSHTLYNGWPVDELTSCVDCNSNYIYYAGRFYPHQLESVYLLLRVLKEYKSVTLKI